MSGAQLTLPDWIDTTGCLPPNLQVQKIFCLRPLRVRLAAVLDLKSQKVVRAKVSVKVCPCSTSLGDSILLYS